MSSALEKPDLDVAFIPIVCAAPLLYAHRHGFFERNGLAVRLSAAPGWSGVKELLVHRRIDAAHMLSPMPFACSTGIDGRRADVKLLAIQNVNGQAVTLAAKHRAVRSVAAMKGMTFGVPYLYSMQYYLLCDWLAKNGLDPLADVRVIEVAPPRMPYYLAKGRVDGLFAPEPYNQVVVEQKLGFIYELSRTIWSGHPCCSLAIHGDFLRACPRTARALTKSVLEAQLALQQADAAKRRAIAIEISDASHLDQSDPAPVVAVLTGAFDDGRGRTRQEPLRVDFVPHAWPEYGTWILAQMQRWGQLPRRIDYAKVVGDVMLSANVDELAGQVGFDAATARRGVEHMPAFDLADPFRSMLGQPYSAFRETPEQSARYDLPAAAAKRLGDVVSTLADVAGGKLDVRLEVTSADEIGELEQTLNEILTNLRFSSDAVLEQRDRLESRVRERTEDLQRELELRERAEGDARALNEQLETIVEQRTAELRKNFALVEQQQEAIRALSMPIIEVGDGILALPIIGAVDDDRVAQITESLLTAITAVKAEYAILDLTGTALLDASTADNLVRIARAVGLLGASALVSGIRPAVAEMIVRTSGQSDLAGISAFRSLRHAVEHCLARRRRRDR